MSQGSFSPTDISSLSGPMRSGMSRDVPGCLKAPSVQQTSQVQVVPCVPGRVRSKQFYAVIASAPQYQAKFFKVPVGVLVMPFKTKIPAGKIKK